LSGSKLTEQTRQAIDDYIRITSKKSGEYLFVGRRGREKELAICRTVTPGGTANSRHLHRDRDFKLNDCPRH
jgi:hypothetical protein